MTRSTRTVAVALVAALAVAIPAFASGGGAPSSGPAQAVRVVGALGPCRTAAAKARHRPASHRARRAVCILTCDRGSNATASPGAVAKCVFRRCPEAAHGLRAVCVVCADPARAGAGAGATPRLLWRCVEPCPPAPAGATGPPGATAGLWLCLPPCLRAAGGASGATGVSGPAAGLTGSTGATGGPAIVWRCPQPCPLVAVPVPAGATGATNTGGFLPRFACPPVCNAAGATGASGTTGATPALCLPLPCAAVHAAILGRWCAPGLPPCGPPIASATRARAPIDAYRHPAHGIMCPAVAGGGGAAPAPVASGAPVSS